MDLLALYNSEIFKWVILPILLFISRIMDVSLGTIRIIYVSRGMKFLAPIVGFFEVILWLIAVGQIMQNLSSPIHYIAYSGGFAMGNLVGMLIEEKLAVGKVVVRVILQKQGCEIARQLSSAGYGVTHMDAEGSRGPVKILLTIVNRREVEKVTGLIYNMEPRAFFTIEDIRFVKEGPPLAAG